MRRIYKGTPGELIPGDQWSYGGEIAPPPAPALSDWATYRSGHAIENSIATIWIAREEKTSEHPG